MFCSSAAKWNFKRNNVVCTAQTSVAVRILISCHSNRAFPPKRWKRMKNTTLRTKTQKNHSSQPKRKRHAFSTNNAGMTKNGCVWYGGMYVTQANAKFVSLSVCLSVRIVNR